MKRILAPILIALTFSMITSSPSYVEWKAASKDKIDNTFYVGFDSITNHSGYVYWWEMIDYPKPTKYGTLSVKFYKQGDCKLFRFKNLSFTPHKEPRGGGTGKVDNKPDKSWTYPPPTSATKIILKHVCAYVRM